jgi:hypothetical protein
MSSVDERAALVGDQLIADRANKVITLITIDACESRMITSNNGLIAEDFSAVVDRIARTNLAGLN